MRVCAAAPVTLCACAGAKVPVASALPASQKIPYTATYLFFAAQ